MGTLTPRQPIAKRSEILSRIIDFKAGEGSQAGTIEGYGAAFGNLDKARDVMRPGSCKASLAAFKKAKEMPGFFWRHDPGEQVGEWLEMEEDSKGLFCKGRLFIEPDRRTEASTKAWNLATSNGPKGFSIGFYPVKWKMDTHAEDGMPFRDLAKVDLVEVSIAPFVINEQAKITNAKAEGNLSLLHDECGNVLTIRNAEATVREALGLSRAEAKALLAGGFAALASMIQGPTSRRDAGDEEALAALVAGCRESGLLPQ
jgi:HK97 family phage prohead protease